MNAERLKRIAMLIEQAQSVMDEIESIKDEEQEYYDNMPESLQGSDKGCAASEAVDNLENAQASMDDAISNLQSIE